MIDSRVLVACLEIVIYIALCYAVGRVCLGWVVRQPSALAVAGSLALGAAALSLQLWGFGIVGVPWNAVTLLLPWVVVGILRRRRIVFDVKEDLRRVGLGARSLYQLDRLSILLIAMAGLIAASYFINLITQPLTAWDALSMWLLKAKHFYTIGAVDLGALWPVHVETPAQAINGLDVADLMRHPDYPPLFPLIVASFYTLIGHVDDTVGKAVNYLFLVVLATSAYAFFRSILDQRLAVTFAFLAVAAPKFIGVFLKNTAGYADYMGMADYAFATCLFLALAHLHTSFTGTARKAGVPDPSYAFALIFAALAALMKNEGLPFFVIVLAIGTVRGGRRLRAGQLKVPAMRQVVPIALVVIAVVGWQGYIRTHGLRSDLLTFTHPADLLPSLPLRALAIAAYFWNIHIFSLHNDFGWVTWSFLLATVLLAANRLRLGGAVYLAVVLQMLSYLIVYLFTPLPLMLHLAESADRLILQLTPAMLLLLGLSLSPYVGTRRLSLSTEPDPSTVSTARKQPAQQVDTMVR